jgi:hypothetical protein
MYAALPQMSATVPTFNVPVPAANGWKALPVQTISGNPGETWAARLRRLAISARNRNPIECPTLIGSVPWMAATAFETGAVVSNGGQVYLATTGGTSAASGGPSGGGFNITDGTVYWDALGLQTAPVVSTLYATHNTAFSQAFNINPAVDYTDGGRFFRLTGGIPYAQYSVWYTMQSATVADGQGNLDGHTKTGNYNAVTFLFEGSICEISIFTANINPIFIIVDDQYIDSLVVEPSGGVARFFSIDFTNVDSQTDVRDGTGRQRHQITVEFAATPFIGVNCLPSSAVSYPEVIDDFSVGLIGDSQVPGSNGLLTQNAYGVQLKHVIGLPDIMLCGIGGTGIVNRGTNTNYIGHCIGDLQLLNAFRPLGVIFIQPSQNDSSFGSRLAAASLALFQALRAAFPTVPIFVTGNITGGGATLAVPRSNETVIAGVVANLQAGGDDLIIFIPSATDPQGPWITGNGNVGTPNGTGNSDVDFSNDGAHMNVAGHSLWARKLAIGVLKAIAKIP